MKALSIRQPWAWLIVNGHKTIENRTWKTTHRGPVLIHASKTPDLTADEMAAYRRAAWEECGVVIPADLPLGGIVGMADLVDCTLTPDDPDSWHEPGCYAFILRSPQPMPFRPMKGRLHFFDVQD